MEHHIDKGFLVLGARKIIQRIAQTQALNHFGNEALYHELEKQRNRGNHTGKNDKD
jgi:hypothetical protein